ncbi:MAG: thioredoxin family protein [Luteolibacter sp.]
MKAPRLLAPMLLLAAVLVLLPGCDAAKKALDKATAAKSPAAAGAGGTGQPAVPGSNPPRELEAQEFDAFTGSSDKLSVVVFHADWCGPCKMLAPVVAGVADSFPGISQVGRFNVDHCRDLAARLKVSGIPDVRFYRGGKEVARFTGYRGDAEVRTFFAQHSAGLTAPAPAAAGSSDAGSVTRMKKNWLPPGMEKR